MRHLSFSAKMITTGVLLKAILMGTLVSLLAITSFEKSLILVLVSATATGIFGIVIVIIQTHSERIIHQRLTNVETQINTKSDEIKTQVGDEAQQIKTQADDIAARADDIAAKTNHIAEVVTPPNGETI